jgi:hypothetical protein
MRCRRAHTCSRRPATRIVAENSYQQAAVGNRHPATGSRATRGPDGSASGPRVRLLYVAACGAAVIVLSCAVTAATADDASRHKILELSVVNGALTGVDNTGRVKQGDEVELRWSSDKPIELHLHGYDIEAKVAPRAPAIMAFKAGIPGRFPVETHGQDKGPHRTVFYLEVYP